MNKKLLIGIGIIIFTALGIIAYIGTQSLKPRAYAPQKTDEKAPLPAPSAQSSEQADPLQQAAPQTALVTPATSEETRTYAAALPQDINPATLKINLLDVRAISYKPNEVFIIERPSALVPSSAWKFNLKTKTLIPIAEREYGLMIRWFDNGRYALMFSVSQTKKPSLVFTDAKTNRRLPLRFATLPNKCAVYGEQPMIYCGVPKTLPPGAILPDDYLKKKLYTDDAIIMIDIEGTRVRELSDENTPIIDVYNPAIINNALFFVNRRDEKIYKLPL